MPMSIVFYCLYKMGGISMAKLYVLQCVFVEFDCSIERQTIKCNCIEHRTIFLATLVELNVRERRKI